jgi:hypothetical protein
LVFVEGRAVMTIEGPVLEQTLLDRLSPILAI